MDGRIRIGICGYGNLGRGVELAIGQNRDMELVAVFTRRNPVSAVKVQSKVPVIHTDFVAEWKDKIDVMILCGGSASDLPAQAPAFSKLFNTVDSFDTHAKIPEYLKAVDESAVFGGHLSIVSVGWDPGLFSLMRLYSEAILPNGKTYTFWGKGVSQGHSDAIRRIDGVENAVQYTVPAESAVEKVRQGQMPELSAREQHTRVCFVVAKAGFNLKKIEKQIQEMPHYFADYDTTVHFISREEFDANHSRLPHGGNVIRSGFTKNNRHSVEFSINLDSNPEFTSSVLVAYARAAYRLYQKGHTGAKTVFDIPPIELFMKNRSEAIKDLL